MTKTKCKRAKVIAEYKTAFKGYQITVPVGSYVTNSTAEGPCDAYRFADPIAVHDASNAWVKPGARNGALLHDLRHYGVNVPADFCEPYPKD